MRQTRQSRTCRLIVLIFSVGMFSVSAFATDWSVQSKNYTDFLMRSGQQVLELPSSNVTAKVISTKKHGKYEVVIYLANVSGTTVMYNVYHAAVYNTETNKIEDTFTYSYHNTDSNKPEGPQPQWEFKKDGSIEIRSVDFPDSPTVLK